MTATDVLKRHEALTAMRGGWDTFAADLANYVMPRKADVLTDPQTPSTVTEARLFDTTAARANQILANGLFSSLTPHETPWFAFSPPPELETEDRVKQWFEKCTEIARDYLSNSNFYTNIHEYLLDLCCFGTACIYVQEGKRNFFNFQTWNFGRYAIAEDEEGFIDTLSREFTLSARAAVNEFGAENVSPKVRELAGEIGKMDEKVKIVQLIAPRLIKEIDTTSPDPKKWAVGSYYIEADSKTLVREGGFKEQPFMVSRFLKRSGEIYGYSPAWVALADARQLNYLQKMMDALAEVTAFPRLLLPDTHKEQVDLRANGITYFNASEPNAIPREWATAGRYDVGLDRVKQKQEHIEKAYFVDMFQMFTNADKQMTATEVAERRGEKLQMFSPAFSRLVTELLNPLLQRVYSMLLRGAKFPPFPEELVMATPLGGMLPEPKVSYMSRVSMIKQLVENAGFHRTIEGIAPIAQMQPEMLDNYDLDKIARGIASNEGLPADWSRSEDEVKQMRDARAQQQAQMQQMQQVEMAANAAGKAGSIKPGSIVGQALANQMQ